MAGKSESYESLLAKAEKFFSRGNYPLALAEFEKAAKMDGRYGASASLAEKIAICRAEADKIRSKELLKKARKLQQKGSLPEAIRSFEEAYAITAEDWIGEKIDELRKQLAGRSASQAAMQAEASGDYGRAAKLYEQAYSTGADENLAIKKARSLVKAESFPEAVEAFRELDLADSGALYDYGFALAKACRYYESLKTWDRLELEDAHLAEQREAVRKLLLEDLWDRFDHAGDSANRADHLAAVYREGAYLRSSLDPHPDLSREVERLLGECRFALIESLWSEERYKEIADLLLPYPADMGPALLAICSKTFFKLAAMSKSHAAHLALFWLTAVHDPDLSSQLDAEAGEREAVRSELIRRADRLLKPLKESGDRALRREGLYWDLEKRLVEKLNRMAGNREEPASMVCTPRFAERFGRSAGVRELIRAEKDYFDDPEQYYAMGAYYSAARESLYLMESGECEEAIASMPETRSDDEFARFGFLKVSYTCGMDYLERKGGRVGRLFDGVAELFEIVPKYEEELVKKAVDAEELEQLEGYEEALARIRRVRPSKPVTEALSIVMSNRARVLYNDNRLDSKAVQALMKEALKLYPENEAARIALKDAREELEVAELQKAMSRHKMSKAFRIAQESEFPRLREEYFSFLEDLVESLPGADLTLEQKVFFFEEIGEWCAKMDPNHPLLDRIDTLLDVMRYRH